MKFNLSASPSFIATVSLALLLLLFINTVSPQTTTNVGKVTLLGSSSSNQIKGKSLPSVSSKFGLFFPSPGPGYSSINPSNASAFAVAQLSAHAFLNAIVSSSSTLTKINAHIGNIIGKLN
jgi:hypothetical protein